MKLIMMNEEIDLIQAGLYVLEINKTSMVYLSVKMRT